MKQGVLLRQVGSLTGSWQLLSLSTLDIVAGSAWQKCESKYVM